MQPITEVTEDTGVLYLQRMGSHHEHKEACKKQGGDDPNREASLVNPQIISN